MSEAAAGFNMPKNVAAKMVHDAFKGEMKSIQTVNEKFYSEGGTLRDQTNNAIKAFSDDMSTPLKRMKVAYLQAVVQDCYKPQHISDDFTNEEQIMLCKKDKHEQVFGEYLKTYRNHRQSDQVRLKHCNQDAGTNVIANVACFEKYIKDIKETNSSLKSMFATQHKEYL